MTDTNTNELQPMPERIGPYVIERELGSGGMGTVYLGRHVDSQELVAIKVLPPSMAREEGFVARFTREIDALRQLSSPNIVQLYESGEQDGGHYYLMEYVEGETLTARLQRDKRIPWQEVIDIGVQICRALKAAHNAGVIHRDLKPSNLLLAKDGTVKLTDFGIAQVFASNKLTVTGGIVGTAEYMSPEQAQGKRATKQSDLYSLGAVLYVMLTGRPPFVGKSALEIAQKHKFAQFDSPRRFVPEVPRWLDEVVCKCLAKKPEDRYPDAYVVGLRLQEIPKKVELSQREDFSTGEAVRPTAETQAADVVHDPRNDLGGTFVRDVVRAQAEIEERPRDVISMLFDNIWGLLALLLIVVCTGLGFAFWSRPSDETLFARGRELMGRPEGTAWETARRSYFAPLLERDPEKWGPQVEPYLRRIELYELKIDLLGKPRNSTATQPTEPERVLRRAHELYELGRTVEARQLLISLQTLLHDDPAHNIQSELAAQLLQQWEKQETSARFEFIEQSLQRAQKLAEEGQLDAAAAIWRSIVTLYDANADAAKYVAEARKHLGEQGKSPVTTSNTSN